MFLLALFLFAGQQEILREFQEFLSIPNVASDTANIRRNADWLTRAFQRRGLRTRLLEQPGSPPAVFAELASPNARRTVMFYAHYDGQPVDPGEWKTPPFAPALQGDRLYARGASDDKGPIIAMLAALDRLTRNAVLTSISNSSSKARRRQVPRLQKIIASNKELLRADVWFICDGPATRLRKQQLYFGVRGVAGLDLTVYGANRELHSGHYGNWSPNPAMMLAQLLASMKDDSGRVLVDGFYDGVEPLGRLKNKPCPKRRITDDDLETGIRSHPHRRHRQETRSNCINQPRSISADSRALPSGKQARRWSRPPRRHRWTSDW